MPNDKIYLFRRSYVAADFLDSQLIDLRIYFHVQDRWMMWVLAEQELISMKYEDVDWCLVSFQFFSTMDDSELLNLPEDEFDAFNDETFGDGGGICIIETFFHIRESRVWMKLIWITYVYLSEYNWEENQAMFEDFMGQEVPNGKKKKAAPDRVSDEEVCLLHLIVLHGKQAKFGEGGVWSSHVFCRWKEPYHPPKSRKTTSTMQVNLKRLSMTISRTRMHWKKAFPV